LRRIISHGLPIDFTAPFLRSNNLIQLKGITVGSA
jgi:hypothetical protein